MEAVIADGLSARAIIDSLNVDNPKPKRKGRKFA
jgi:hypothetical protein